jgi:hypothetical protein
MYKQGKVLCVQEVGERRTEEDALCFDFFRRMRCGRGKEKEKNKIRERIRTCGPTVAVL